MAGRFRYLPVKRPLVVRWRLARHLCKFTGNTGLRAWWFVLKETLRG